MPSSDSDRIAVLIDADNTSPKHAGALLQEVAKYGSATVKRAYGDWTTQQLAGWKSTLNQLAVQPMQQFAYTTGKNSTDSALIIDAMDLLYSENVDAFAIVSSDSDFTRLATRLRESGRTVIGFGLRKTPRSLVSACDRFVYLELLEAGSADEPAADPRGHDTDHDAGQAPAQLPDLRRLLTSAVDAASHDDGWASLSSVANHVNRSNPSFDVRAYGESKLANLARAQAWLDVEQVDNGVRVRLSDGRPAKKTTKRSTSRSKAKAAPVDAVEPDDAPAPVPLVEQEGDPAPQPLVEQRGAPAPSVVETSPAPVKKTTRTRTRKTAAAPPPEATPEPAPEPTPEPAPEPAKPQVVTRTRSRKPAGPA